MTVKVMINEQRLFDMLKTRLNEFTTDKDVIALYMDMYERYIDDGVFESMEFDPLYIVDNDYINYCQVISEGDAGFDKLLAIYKAQGLGDCSCEDAGDTGANFIEAVDDDEEPAKILIRQ